jgi:chemotaxis protein histidine kinase CheA
MTEDIKVKNDSRTISSETRKIFMTVFVVLATVGLFAVSATWKGKSVFSQIESTQLPLFRNASKLTHTTLDIVAIYYLLSGENDLDLQMQQMWRYDGLEADFKKTLKSLSDLAQDIDDDNAAKEISSFATGISSQFEELNALAREMMLANMNGDRAGAKTSFGLLTGRIEKFRDAVNALEQHVSENLKVRTGSALRVLTGSSIAGVVLTLASTLLTLGLIRYLMSFLSISLLPISNLMHNLRQSVFSVDKSGQVVSPVSKYSETIFKDNIVGQSLDNLVLSHLGKKSESYASAKTAMTSVFGEDDMQWSLMEDNFPTVVRRTVGAEEKALKLTYTPLFNEKQTVENIMIVAEDVTELERAKAEATKKQAEVRVLQGLIGVDRTDLTAFFADTIAGLKLCNSLITTMQDDLEARKLIFRTLHTIKGNSRLYNLLAISEVIHLAENAVVEINTRLDAKEPVGSEFYDAYLRGLRDSDEVVAAHTRVAKTMFGIDDSMSASRFRQLEELMWFLEHGAAIRQGPLFNPEELMAAGLEVQHAMVLIDPRWEKNIEQLRKIAHHFGSQEIVESADRLLTQAQIPDGDIADAFRNLQDCVFRFCAQSAHNRPYKTSFDEIVPVLNLLVTLNTFIGRTGESIDNPAFKGALMREFYECYLLTDADDAVVKFRHLLRLGMLGLVANDKDRLRYVAKEFTHALAWLTSTECSFTLSTESRDELAAVMPNSFATDGAKASFDVQISELLICAIVETDKYGNIGSSHIISELSRAVGSESLTDRISTLLGSSGLAERMNQFVELIKGGIGTDVARSAVKAFISGVGSPAEAALYERSTASISDRLHFLRTVGGFTLDASDKAESGATKTMEVTTDWFAKITEMADMLQVAPNNDLESLHEELQELLASVFDYPLFSLCTKMSPMVKDLSIKLGKNINYIVTGDPLSLPREQAYALRDALVHMLRNSLDHGIEMPSVRAEAGKPEVATIEINCLKKSDDLIEINVSDDGAGIDIEKVKKKAVAIGAISADTAATMKDIDAVQLIFISRLSTKEEVSSLSGRGVGMDAVKSIIVDRMKGQIVVESAKSGGTRFKMTTKRAKRREGKSNLDEMTSFLLNAAKDVADCIDTVAIAKSDTKVAQNIFRNLHTIKGNATLLGLKSVEEKTHEAESLAVILLSGDSAAEKTAAADILPKLSQLHKELLELLRKRSSGQSGARDEVSGFLAKSSADLSELLYGIDGIFSDAALSDEVLRVLHTIKSNAAIHNQSDLADKVHHIETVTIDVINAVNSGKKVKDEEMQSLHKKMRETHDFIVTMLSGANGKSRKSADLSPAARLIEDVRHVGSKILGELEKIVSQADKAADIFRELHTLKGTAAMHNNGQLVDALHRAEGALDAICKRLSEGRSVSAEQTASFRDEMVAVGAIADRQRQKTGASGGSNRSKQGGSESDMLMRNLDEYLKPFAAEGQLEFKKESQVDALMRELHTNKGNAEMLGLKSLVQVIHAAEDLTIALGAKVRAGHIDEIHNKKLQAAIREIRAACAAGGNQNGRRRRAV